MGAQHLNTEAVGTGRGEAHGRSPRIGCGELYFLSRALPFLFSSSFIILFVCAGSCQGCRAVNVLGQSWLALRAFSSDSAVPVMATRGNVTHGQLMQTRHSLARAYRCFVGCCVAPECVPLRLSPERANCSYFRAEISLEISIMSI